MERIKTKICSKCKIEKPLTDFHKNGFDKYGNQKYRGYCKNCANALEKNRYKKKKEYINSFKSECKKCGENRQYVLDFHHLNSEEKDFTIGQFRKGSFSILKEEIEKCVVLCSNCHREYHFLNKEIGLTLEDYLKGNYTLE